MYLTQGLHRYAQQSPHATACVFEDRVTTFAMLINRVADMAARMIERGVQSGDRVALLGQNSDHYLVGYLASWWAGAVAVPINNRWGEPEMAAVLNDCEVRLWLVDADYQPLAQRVLASVPCPGGCLTMNDAVVMRASKPSATDKRPATTDRCGQGDALAAIFFTGGTTGTPKGVMLSHLNIWASTMARMAEIHSPRATVVLHSAPFFHVAAAGRLFGQIIAGSPSIILPAFKPHAVLEAIEAHKVDEIMLVPSMIQMVLDHPAFSRANLSSLRRITYGASPISETLLKRIISVLPEVELVQAFGQTEASPIISIHPAENHRPTSAHPHRLRSAGHASMSVEIKIVDDQDEEVPLGVVGEITARGPNIMLGYWRRPTETAQALRHGWLHTGDAGYMDEDGYIYVVDRLKDMIISGGENVYCAEVENALATHPAVSQCAVIGIPSEIWGESVHAVVVLKTGDAVDDESLRQHCKALIGGYKSPKTIEFRDELPMSAAGKVLKASLRAPFWSDLPRKLG